MVIRHYEALAEILLRPYPGVVEAFIKPRISSSDSRGNRSNRSHRGNATITNTVRGTRGNRGNTTPTIGIPIGYIL